NQFMHIGEFSIQSGYELMKKALEGTYADAYIIASDAMAMGALRALYEAQIDVPNKVSIISFNDIPQSAYTIPALTTVKIYQEFMGQSAIDLMIERLKGRTISKKIIVTTKLIVRNTTKEIKL
ncbi:MAG: substrate-binding domain-containing protein, partial [Acholeplasmataceae bacterium]